MLVDTQIMANLTVRRVPGHHLGGEVAKESV